MKIDAVKETLMQTKFFSSKDGLNARQYMTV